MKRVINWAADIGKYIRRGQTEKEEIVRVTKL